MRKNVITHATWRTDGPTSRRSDFTAAVLINPGPGEVPKPTTLDGEPLCRSGFSSSSEAEVWGSKTAELVKRVVAMLGG